MTNVKQQVREILEQLPDDCSIEDVPHVELNGHILIPLQNVASVHCSSRCDAPEPDWPPRGLTEDDVGEA